MNLKESTKLYSLLRLGPMDLDRKMNIWNQIMKTAYVPGDVVEIGCYKGASTALFRFLMNTHCPEKELFIYDGFQGLFGNSSKDGNSSCFKDGTFFSTPGDVLDLFKAHELRPPVIKESLVQDMKPEDLPERISLALLDVDLYKPMKIALELVWPRMVNNAILIIDDYQMTVTPGVEKATQEFFSPQDQERITTPAKATGVIKKKIIEWGRGAQKK